MSKKLLWLSLLVGMLLGLLALPAAAQEDGSETETPVAGVDEVTDDEVNDVAKDLYCPVCENTPLDVCPTKACADWRELIRTKLAQGESKQDIFDYFVRQYGDSALAQPPRTGINFILWLLPFVAVGLGLVFFARYMKGLRNTEPAAADAVESGAVAATVVAEETSRTELAEVAVSDEPAADDYAARIEKELKEK